MATKRQRRREVPTEGLAPVKEMTAVNFVEDAMRIYGSEVNTDRAVPDYRDGFKPVARRLMYAMSLISSRPSSRHVKSARVVGDTLGKFHPHGDISAYGGMVTQATNCVPPFDGDGNWGDGTGSPAAAYRYTNVRLSVYGSSFFHRNYSPIVTKVPNFDQSFTEPLVLPSLFPNLLLNGSSAVGVGMVSHVPAFTPQSLLKVMIRLIDGEALDERDYAKSLDFHYELGGRVVKNKENFDKVVEFFGGHKGSIRWASNIEVDEENKRIKLLDQCPGVNLIKFIDEKLKENNSVSQVVSDEGTTYVVRCRRGIGTLEFNKLVEFIKKGLSSTYSYEVTVTERKVTNPDTGAYDVLFHQLSIPELIIKWLRWRVALEKASLAYQMQATEKEIALRKLLILAISNIDILASCLKTKDPRAAIVKGLKITPEEADILLARQLKTFAKLEAEKLHQAIAELNAHLKKLTKLHKKPAQSVRAFFEEAIPLFTKVEKYPGMYTQLLSKVPGQQEISEGEEVDPDSLVVSEK